MSKMCYRCLRETVNNGRCTSCNAPAVERLKDDGLLPLGSLLDEGSIIVGDKLGKGGFGATYIARDLTKDRLIALKEFLPQHMVYPDRQGMSVRVVTDKRDTYEQSMRSFIKESRLLKELCHPNIVRVYFELDENNTAYYGMELLQGMDLKAWARDRGKISPLEACQLLLPIMDALDYIHTEKGTLHRDISPDNVFIRTGEQYPEGFSPCLIDFGAAYTAMRDFTKTAGRVRKNGFSPIEQNWGPEREGPFTDVYALAATYYYLVTGQVPIPSQDRNLSNDQLKKPSELNHAVTPAIERAILRALAIQPANRTQNVKSFRADLCTALGIPVPAPVRITLSARDRMAPHPPEPPKPQPVINQNVSTPSQVDRSEGAPSSVVQNSVASQINPSVPNEQFISYIPEEQKKNRSSAPLISALIDWGLFLGLPTIIAGSISPALGLLLGALLMLGINTILCSLSDPGTLGQRLMRLHLKDVYGNVPSSGKLLVYNAIRTLFPVELADELAALLQNNPQSALERMTSIRLSGQNLTSQPAMNSMPVSVLTPGQSGFPSTPSVSVQESQPHVQLVCQAGMMQGRVFPLSITNTLGRDARHCSILFPETETLISGTHCIVYFEGGCWYVKDRGSRNGTVVNGVKLPRDGKSKPLKNGDVIQLGEEVLIFKITIGG